MAGSIDRSRWLTSGAGPLINLRIALSDQFWRIGPAWSVLAGALAGGIAPTGSTAVLLAGGILLADCAWGSVWGLMAGGRSIAPAPESISGLPYAQADAPLYRALRRLHSLASGASWHEVFAGVLASLGLALLMGLPAILLTIATLALAVAAQLIAERGRRPHLVHALLVAGLPWVLGLSLAGRITDPGTLLLGVAFTALAWGAEQRGAPLWLGQGAVLVALLVLRLAWPILLVSGLFVAPSIWSAQAGSDGRAVQGSAPWWWAAMIISALGARLLVTAG